MNYMTDEKRYNTLSNYYKSLYNKKVTKVPLNANFTCPNKTGLKGINGCMFCSKSGSGDFAGNIKDDILTQYEKIKIRQNQKWNDTLYIPYFQANSNTYGDINKLKIFEKFIDYDKKIIKISIATRPDCFNNEIYDYLETLNKKIPIQIELGLQTANDIIKKNLNINHTNLEFIDACSNLKKRNIEVVAHIINGLPNETIEDMLNTIKLINKAKVDGIKIHMLHIMKNTSLYEYYLLNPFKVLSIEEYTDICCMQIRKLNPNIIIHRLTGDSPKEELVEPVWTLKKFVVMNEIDKKMRKNNWYQGEKYEKCD